MQARDIDEGSIRAERQRMRAGQAIKKAEGIDREQRPFTPRLDKGQCAVNWVAAVNRDRAVRGSRIAAHIDMLPIRADDHTARPGQLICRQDRVFKADKVIPVATKGDQRIFARASHIDAAPVGADPNPMRARQPLDDEIIRVVFGECELAAIEIAAVDRKRVGDARGDIELFAIGTDRDFARPP